MGNNAKFGSEAVLNGKMELYHFALPEDMFDTLLIVRNCYHGGSAGYIRYLIEKDMAQNKDKYEEWNRANTNMPRPVWSDSVMPEPVNPIPVQHPRAEEYEPPRREERPIRAIDPAPKPVKPQAEQPYVRHDIQNNTQKAAEFQQRLDDVRGFDEVPEQPARVDNRQNINNQPERRPDNRQNGQPNQNRAYDNPKQRDNQPQRNDKGNKPVRNESANQGQRPERQNQQNGQTRPNYTENVKPIGSGQNNQSRQQPNDQRKPVNYDGGQNNGNRQPQNNPNNQESRRDRHRKHKISFNDAPEKQPQRLDKGSLDGNRSDSDRIKLDVDSLDDFSLTLDLDD